MQNVLIFYGVSRFDSKIRGHPSDCETGAEALTRKWTVEVGEHGAQLARWEAARALALETGAVHGELRQKLALAKGIVDVELTSSYKKLEEALCVVEEKVNECNNDEPLLLEEVSLCSYLGCSVLHGTQTQHTRSRGVAGRCWLGYVTCACASHCGRGSRRWARCQLNSC